MSKMACKSGFDFKNKIILPTQKRLSTVTCQDNNTNRRADGKRVSGNAVSKRYNSSTKQQPNKNMFHWINFLSQWNCLKSPFFAWLPILIVIPSYLQSLPHKVILD